MTTFPSSPTDGTLSDDERFVYDDPPGAWRRRGSTFSTDLENLRDQLADKADRTELEDLDLGGNAFSQVQVLSGVSGVTAIDLSQGLYVKVLSTAGAWQPEFVNWPSGGSEVILSVDTSGSHVMTAPEGTDWDTSDTAPVSGDWVAGTRMVMRFTRMALDEGLIGELLRDTTVPDPDPTVPAPTITAGYSTSSDLSGSATLSGATLPAEPVYIWFGPSGSDVAEMQIFFNAGTLPAIGEEETDDTFVRSSSTYPHHLMPGSTPSEPIAWDPVDGDPTGNLLESYNPDGSNTVTGRAIMIDGQSYTQTITFDTTAPTTGSSPTRVSTQNLYTSGAAIEQVTIPTGVDRAVLVHALFRNGVDSALTGLTLNGVAMTVGASDWYFSSQRWGALVCTLDEADLTTGTHDLVPVWTGEGPTDASLIGYRVDVFTNVDTPTWNHDLDYYNAATDRAPTIPSVENAYLVTSSAEQTIGGAAMTVSGITPTTLEAQEEESASWLDMAFRSAVVDDSGAASTQTATWDTASKGIAALSSLEYTASAGGSGGVTPVVPGTVAQPTLDNAVDNRLTVTWTAAADASYYQVRWGQSNPPARTPVRVDSGLTFTITGLAAASTQYVQVRAVSSTGTPSAAWSTVASSVVAGDTGGGTPGTVTNKFEVSFDPYDVTMSEGNGAMRYDDLYLPLPWRRVNASSQSEASISNIVANAIAQDRIVGRFNSSRKTPFQAQVGPRLIVTTHMHPAGHGAFKSSNPQTLVEELFSLAATGSTGSNNRDWVWRKHASDINQTITVAGQSYNLVDHVCMSISHEANGSWSRSYWGNVPLLKNHPALNNPSTTLWGSAMADAIQYVHDTGLLTKVHARNYEHISDIYDDENPKIIRGMSPALSRTSEPYDPGQTGQPLSSAWYDEAFPEYGVDFLIPTIYWRKNGLAYDGSGSTTDPLNYVDDTNWGSFAIAIAERLGAAYGHLEFGTEYALANTGKSPGGDRTPTDLEVNMAFKRNYDHVLPSVSTGLFAISHWLFYTTANGTKPGPNNSFHPLEGVWGQLKDGFSFSGTGRPTSGMVNQSSVPASNTRYPLTLDWFRDEFPTSKLD